MKSLGVSFGVKDKTELEVLQKRAKSQPGPADYTVEAKRSGLGGRFMLSNPRTTEDYSREEAAAVPGPGRYEHQAVPSAGTRPRSSLGGRHKLLDDRIRDLHYPGPGHYSIPDLPTVTVGQPPFGVLGVTELEQRLRLAAEVPGPGAYPVTETKLPRGGRISKSERKSQTEIDLERIKGLPGPGAYGPDILPPEVKKSKRRPQTTEPVSPSKGGGGGPRAKTAEGFRVSDTRPFSRDAYVPRSTTPGPGQYQMRATSLLQSGGRFNLARPKSDVEVNILRASKLPSPGQYYQPLAHSNTAQKFNQYNAPSDVDLMIARAATTPGPGEYGLPMPVQAQFGRTQIGAKIGTQRRPGAGDNLPGRDTPGPGQYDPQLLDHIGGGDLPLGPLIEDRVHNPDVPGPGSYPVRPCSVPIFEASLPPHDYRRVNLEWDELFKAVHRGQKEFLDETTTDIIKRTNAEMQKPRPGSVEALLAETKAAQAEKKRLAAQRAKEALAALARTPPPAPSVAEPPPQDNSSLFLTAVSVADTEKNRVPETAEDINVDVSDSRSFLASFFPAKSGRVKVEQLVKLPGLRNDIVTRTRAWVHPPLPVSRRKRKPVFPPKSEEEHRKKIVPEVADAEAPVILAAGDSTMQLLRRRGPKLSKAALSKMEKSVKTELDILLKEIHTMSSQLRVMQCYAYGTWDDKQKTDSQGVDHIFKNIYTVDFQDNSSVHRRAVALVKALESLDRAQGALQKGLGNRLEMLVSSRAGIRGSADRTAVRLQKEAMAKTAKFEREGQRVMLTAMHHANFLNGLRMAYLLHKATSLLESRKHRAARSIQTACMRKFMPDRLKKKQAASITIVCGCRRFLWNRKRRLRAEMSGVVAQFLQDASHMGMVKRAVTRYLYRVRTMQATVRAYLSWKHDILRQFIVQLDRVLCEPVASVFSRDSETTQRHRERLKKIRGLLMDLAKLKPLPPPLDSRNYEKLLDPNSDLQVAVPMVVKRRIAERRWMQVRLLHVTQVRDWKQQVQDHKKEKRHIQFLLMALPEHNRSIKYLPSNVRRNLKEILCPPYPLLPVTSTDDEIGVSAVLFLSEWLARVTASKKTPKSKVPADHRDSRDSVRRVSVSSRSQEGLFPRSASQSSGGFGNVS